MTNLHEVTEEELAAILEAEANKPKEQLDRGAFMIRLLSMEGSMREHGAALREQYQELISKMEQLDSMREKIMALEDSGFRLKYYTDDEGNLSYEAAQKDRLGFLK